MKKTIGAIFTLSLLSFSNPAHAVEVLYQIDTLNIMYPGNNDLSGQLYIQDVAPSVPPYEASVGPNGLALNGDALTPITSGVGYIYSLTSQNNEFAAITFPAFPNDPLFALGGQQYGEAPLILFPSDIFLNGIPGDGGTISTEFCESDLNGSTNCSHVSNAPLPPALPMFGLAIFSLAGFSFLQHRKSAQFSIFRN